MKRSRIEFEELKKEIEEPLMKAFSKLNFKCGSEPGYDSPKFTDDEIQNLNMNVPLGDSDLTKDLLLTCLFLLNRVTSHKYEENFQGEAVPDDEYDSYIETIQRRVHEAGVPWDYVDLASDAKNQKFMSIILSDNYKKNKMIMEQASIKAQHYLKYDCIVNGDVYRTVGKERKKVDVKSMLIDHAKTGKHIEKQVLQEFDRILKENGLYEKSNKMLELELAGTEKTSFGDLPLLNNKDEFVKEYNQLKNFIPLTFKQQTKLNDNQRDIYNRCREAMLNGKFNSISSSDKEVFNATVEAFQKDPMFIQQQREAKINVYEQFKTSIEIYPKPRFYQIVSRFKLWRCEVALDKMKADMLSSGITEKEISDFEKQDYYDPGHFDREAQHNEDVENLSNEVLTNSTRENISINLETEIDTERAKGNTQDINTAVKTEEKEQEIVIN